jgi:hypothetical protein
MTFAGTVGPIVAAAAGLLAVVTIVHAGDSNDYPTSARAASLLPYDSYVTAETVLSMS